MLEYVFGGWCIVVGIALYVHRGTCPKCGFFKCTSCDDRMDKES